VDDLPILRERIGALTSIHPEMQVCGQARVISTVLKLVDEPVPDVVAADNSLQNESGLDFVRRDTSKRCDSCHAIAAIRQILHGKKYLSDELKGRLRHPNARTKAGVDVEFRSSREFEDFRRIGAGITMLEWPRVCTSASRPLTRIARTSNEN
jgi:DNA-binding NarL/FixJ family response regulator